MWHVITEDEQRAAQEAMCKQFEPAESEKGKWMSQLWAAITAFEIINAEQEAAK